MNKIVLFGIVLFTMAFVGSFSAYRYVEALSWTSPPAPSSVEMHGYAWSDNIGWISFNCDNTSTCGTSDYRVTIDSSDGSLDGYAWSDNIGWIKFGDLSGFPEGSNGNAFIDSSGSDVYIYGWARACTVFQSNCSGTLKSSEELGGWDGWISFNCDDLAGGCGSNPVYGPKLIEGASSGLIASSEPYAWGGDVIGWITMSPVSFDFPYEPGPFACNHTPAEESLSQDMWGQITTTACTGVRVCSETTYTCTDPVPPVLVDFSSDSKVVRAGESTTINWTVTDANDCTVTGPSGVVGTGLSGSGSSGAINNLSNFKLSCVPSTGGLTVPVGTLTVQTVGTRIEI